MGVVIWNVLIKRVYCSSVTSNSCLQARIEAQEAAKAERRAATASLRAVEGGIDFYAKAKNFDKLKEIAEASGVATKVLTLPALTNLTNEPDLTVTSISKQDSKAYLKLLSPHIYVCSDLVGFYVHLQVNQQHLPRLMPCFTSKPPFS